jgi:hypothetical protein
VQSILAKAGARNRSELHYRHLTSPQKRIVVGKITRLPVRGFVLASNKKNMRGYRNERAERVRSQQWFYNFCLRLLLERVTDYCFQHARRDRAKGGRGADAGLDFRLDAVVNMVPPGLVPGRCPGHRGYWQRAVDNLKSACAAAFLSVYVVLCEAMPWPESKKPQAIAFIAAFRAALLTITRVFPSAPRFHHSAAPGTRLPPLRGLPRRSQCISRSAARSF